jgi:hypothetical protein
MAIYRVIQEWTNYRIVEVEADTAEQAEEAVNDNEGTEVNGGTEAHLTTATSVMDEVSGYWEDLG